MSRLAGLGSVALISVAASVCSCSAVGPAAVPRDRLEYATSIADSWKTQTLLNIVRLRYGDVPTFLEVTQVVAGYQTQTAITGNFSAGNATNTEVGALVVGGSASAARTYTDRPTVVYVPLVGLDFLKALMTPIPPSAVLFLLQSGYSATQLLPLVVESMNGLPNGSFRSERPADPRFRRAIELLSAGQISNALQIRVERPKEEAPFALIVFPPPPDPKTRAMGQEFRQLLGLRPDVQQLTVYYGGYSGKDDEIDMLTRSMLQIMLEFAAMIRIPRADVVHKRARPGLTDAPDAAPADVPIRILSTRSRPSGAYVAVEYDDRWFWIADNDIQSKLAFASLMLLFSISDTGIGGTRPMVTIPVNQ